MGDINLPQFPFLNITIYPIQYVGNNRSSEDNHRSTEYNHYSADENHNKLYRKD